MKDALDPNPRDARVTVQRLHLNWYHASPHQLKRILVSAAGANKLLLDVSEDTVGQREMCQALDKAAYLLAAGASWSLVQVGTLCLDDIGAISAIYGY